MSATTDPIWADFLSRTIAEFACTTGTLHRLNPADQELKLVAQQGVPDALMPVIQSIPVGKGIAGVAAERKEAVEMCNLQTDTSGIVRPGAQQTHVQGTLVVPVLDGERLCGTLGIGKLVPYDFTAEEKEQLLQAGQRIAAELLK